jgi:hypothetical protein
MASTGDFGEILSVWAAGESTVSGLALIGSRERAAADPVWSADAHSDWDFYVITSRPALFANRVWAAGLPGQELRHYVHHRTTDSRAPKVCAFFAGAEVDLVILSLPMMRLVRLLVAAGIHRRKGFSRRGLRAIAEVIRPGWKFLKGGAQWDPLFQRIVTEIPDPRMSDSDAILTANVLVGNYVWIRRKLARGEIVAAQRMIHREMAEANLRLLHELRLRRGERSFEKGRRIERVAPPGDMALVTVSARCDPGELETALERSAESCRLIMRGLVGNNWSWPQL